LPIFETVLNRYTVRGSIVGTRQDLQEAIDFAVAGKVRATVHAAKLEDINSIFAEMKKGDRGPDGVGHRFSWRRGLRDCFEDCGRDRCGGIGAAGCCGVMIKIRPTAVIGHDPLLGKKYFWYGITYYESAH
jgi:hypothetical protein